MHSLDPVSRRKLVRKMTPRVLTTQAAEQLAHAGRAGLWGPLTARRGAALLALIVLATLGLRGYGLGWRSLWFDEAFSWRLAEFPGSAPESALQS